jgi:hypothetical protein
MNNYKIQSILIKNDLTLDEATQYIIDHKYKIKQIDVTDNFYRFRQLSPDYLKRLGFTKYISKIINDKPKIELIIAYQK